MRFYLLTDNDDIAVGLRLAGIEGEIIADKDSAENKINDLINDENIGMILINTSLYEKCSVLVSQIRKSHTIPVIVEIPDKNTDIKSNAISDYVREAIGIKI